MNDKAAQPNESFAAEVARGEKHSFSSEEVEALQAMAKFWLGAQQVGKAAHLAQRVVVWIGWAAAAVYALRTFLREWLH